MSENQEKKRPIKTLDDIVFETRNKEYGCYHLNSTYRRRLLASVIWAFSIFLFIILTVYLAVIRPWNRRFDQSDLVQMDSISYDHTMVTLLSQLSEIQPDQPKPIAISLEAGAESDVLRNSNVRREIPRIESKVILQEVDTSHRRLVDDLLRKHESEVNKGKSIQSDSITIILEKVPQFPGGYTAVQSYFYKNQHYPENALIHGIHGSTMVSFVVNQNGVVERAKVVKGIDPELDREAIRLVIAMPHWQPASYKGKPIASLLIMPVNFSIK